MANPHFAATRPPSTRPRLVEVSEPGGPGPISPELVLVSPDLWPFALAALAETPRWAATSPAEASADRNGRDLAPGAVGEVSPGETAAADADDGRIGETHYDTPDRRLDAHGLSLVRSRSEAGATWRLSLARGERVELPGAAGDHRPPVHILALLKAVVADEPLGPVTERTDQLVHLEEQIRHQGHEILRHDPGTRLALDPENLHSLRVATRRLRAFLRVGRLLVDREWAEEVREALAELGRVLGPARDLDVLIENLKRDAATLDDLDRRAADALIERLANERDDLQPRLLEALDRPTYRLLLERLRLPVPAAEERPKRSLADLARREIRRLEQEVRRLGEQPTDEALHLFRIRVKRMRYATELGGGAGDGHAERLVRAAKRLQDVLGEHQDTVVAEQRLHDLAAEAEPPVAYVAGRLAERETQRRARLREQVPPAWRKLRRATRRRG